MGFLLCYGHFGSASWSPDSPFVPFEPQNGPFYTVYGERNKQIRKTHIKNFIGSQGGVPGGRFRGPNSLCWCRCFSPAKYSA